MVKVVKELKGEGRKKYAAPKGFGARETIPYITNFFYPITSFTHHTCGKPSLTV